MRVENSANHPLCQANQYPWVMMLEVKKLGKNGLKKHVYLCGGTLIASKYIISAAHCVFDEYFGNQVKESDIKVRTSNISMTRSDTLTELYQLVTLRKCVHDYKKNAYWQPPILVTQLDLYYDLVNHQ